MTLDFLILSSRQIILLFFLPHLEREKLINWKRKLKGLVLDADFNYAIFDHFLLCKRQV